MKQINFNLEQQEKALAGYDRNKRFLYALEMALREINNNEIKRTGAHPRWTNAFIHEKQREIDRRVGNFPLKMSLIRMVLGKMKLLKGEKKVKCVNGCVRVVEVGI